MELKIFKTFFTEQLSTIYPRTEIESFFFLLVEECLNFERIDTILKADYSITKNQLSFLNKALERLKKEEPIQYILGKTEFYGLPFSVDKNILIPRPETEELVDWVLEVAKLKSCKVEKSKTNVTSNILSTLNINSIEKPITILDIGTGTGCIPISLKKHLPNTKISAIDISKNALKVAKKNAALNNVNVDFFEFDILKTTTLNVIAREEGLKHSTDNDEMLNQVQHDKKFDIIVSNPPYVRELEKAEIKNNVLENEPHLALFVEDNNPLIFYKKIADLAKKHLSKNGMLFFEINQYLGKETLLMLKKKGFYNIELKKDFFDNDRMIKAEI